MREEVGYKVGSVSKNGAREKDDVGKGKENVNLLDWVSDGVF